MTLVPTSNYNNITNYDLLYNLLQPRYTTITAQPYCLYVGIYAVQEILNYYYYY